MWILILSELLVFSAFFVLFAWQRSLDPTLFNAGQMQLDPVLGGVNTLLLLTSGLFAALAVQAITLGDVLRCRRWLALTMLLGLAFCVVKLLEYAAKIAMGLTPETSNFFSYYYLLTAFHLAHVIFGLGLLALAYWKTSLQNLETSTAFWHMVDLIWVMLYPLLYLLR
ncbi:cytochrome c oxidase subunit 3 family protein [Seongchinamella unica]|uniref:Cytochrome c oxidase subunit 3 family protein n=1 Tax=Seongchinamella unica TaxID=2547392 RepID=A0A4R5LQ65_9GAMM|nr:cytochrome c oxidase subunit 3 family protein [Seongchinamella unica]TDG12615.1 cytochrome c oxidase subunit 3 family protein [Seongchinamella unica]